MLLLCFFSQAFLGSKPSKNHLQSAGKNKKLLIQSLGRFFLAVVIWDHRHDEPLLLGLLPFFPSLLQSFLLPQCLFSLLHQHGQTISVSSCWMLLQLPAPPMCSFPLISFSALVFFACLPFVCSNNYWILIHPLWGSQLMLSIWFVFQTPPGNCFSFLYLAFNLQLSLIPSELGSGWKAKDMKQSFFVPLFFASHPEGFSESVGFFLFA